MDGSLSAREHIERIDSRLRLIVSPEFGFGTDALLLAAFALPRPGEQACDLGTGCGIIPFYWLSRGARQVWGVELQTAACEQAERSAALSGVTDRFTVVNADLRALRGVLPGNSFDLLTMNPPYYKAGHGAQSRTAADRTARHETALTLRDLTRSAARLLKFGGRFCICLPPERLTEALCEFRAAGLEPKRLRFAAHTAGKAPWLFLLEGKKGRRPGLTVEAELTVRTPEGAYTPEMRSILGEYGKD